MSTFKQIHASEIEAGQPIKATTQNKIKDNFDNLNERVTAAETGASTVYAPLIMRVNGPYGEAGDLQIPANGILKTTTNFNMQITGIRVLIDKAGISGTTTIDIKKKTGTGAWVSVFQVKPSVVFSMGDDASSVNGELNVGTSTIAAGDLLRLDIEEAQKRASGLLIRIDYIKV